MDISSSPLNNSAINEIYSRIGLYQNLTLRWLYTSVAYFGNRKSPRDNLGLVKGGARSGSDYATQYFKK